ncbi:LysR substrate-binding domain-containing protein [Virgibacillus halodenitrificans]|uniref:LysR substrate-binding domain-containing protein n=1 Tax=Virgibacillus halodenitrificans TaxID=1482 RepID=UPI00045CE2D1|nr:LysR substrate-binding domain-containing protein [Virgibacillus halodenitrificans]CDQ32062.1 Hca operon transcriptional activator [Virgibacillus halodenitrificans]
METRHIRYFIAIAEELSFSKAAKRLNISQPPLSKQIKDLENYLNQKLFSRDNKKVELTEAGKNFLLRSYKIMKEIEDTKHFLQTFNKAEKKEISIGFSETALKDLIPIVRTFNNQSNNIDIKLHRLSSPKQLSSIENNFIDLGFICSPIQQNKYKVYSLNEHHYNIVLPKSHSLSNYNEPISVNQLKEETFIITPRKVSPAYYDAAFPIFGNNSFYPKKTITAYNTTAIIALITAGLGVAFMPSSINQFFSSNENITFNKIKDAPVIETSIIWNPNNITTETKKIINIAKNLKN